MDKASINQLKNELSLEAKNGIDFIISASFIWGVIAFIWTLDFSILAKSIYTFYAGALMLPLAFLLSKVLKTNWKVKHNPLQPLGLWLNFAQLFYFPLLLFIFWKNPDYFVMAYVVITAAHFFPYAWYYDEKIYAILSGVISIGALVLALNVPVAEMYWVPAFMSFLLAILAIGLFVSYKKKIQLQTVI